MGQSFSWSVGSCQVKTTLSLHLLTSGQLGTILLSRLVADGDFDYQFIFGVAKNLELQFIADFGLFDLRDDIFIGLALDTVDAANYVAFFDARFFGRASLVRHRPRNRHWYRASPDRL